MAAANCGGYRGGRSEGAEAEAEVAAEEGVEVVTQNRSGLN